MMSMVADRYVSAYIIKLTADRINIDVQRIAEQNMTLKEVTIVRTIAEE